MSIHRPLIVCLALFAGIVLGRAALADVSPAGNLVTTVPIDVEFYPGIAPGLSLSYSSSGGNGIAGVGWTLSGPSFIVRASPGRGAPTYDASDVFLLDGQELVPCSTAPGSATRLSPSCIYPAATPDLVYYTTRIESFQRIARKGEQWYLWTKDGTKRTYFAQWFSASTRNQTYRWALAQVEDVHGNFAVYDYRADSTNLGVIHEYYLSSIQCWGKWYRYKPLMQVDFYYESRPDPVSFAIGGGHIGAGAPLATMRERLKSIAVSNTDPSDQKQLVRVYKLGYSPSVETGRSLLASVQQFGLDATLDQSGTIMNEATATKLPPRRFGVAAPGVPGTFTATKDEPFAGNEPAIAPANPSGDRWDLGAFWSNPGTTCVTLDLDGDGATDSVCAEAHASHGRGSLNGHLQLHVQMYPRSLRRSAPNPPPPVIHTDTTTPYGVPMTSDLLAGDFTGDGKGDLVVFRCGDNGGTCDATQSSMYALRGNGDGTFTQYFALPSAFSHYPRDWSRDQFFLSTTIDVDRDGLLDVVIVADEWISPHTTFLSHRKIIWVFRSTGTGFDRLNRITVADWIDGGFSLDPQMGYTSVRQLMAGDFDGDGRGDIMLLSRLPSNAVASFEHPVLFVALSRATGLEPLPPIELADYDWSSFHFSCEHSWSVGDVNGDGRTDLTAIYPAMSNGTKFNAIRTYISQGDGTFAVPTVAADEITDVPMTGCPRRVFSLSFGGGGGSGGGSLGISLGSRWQYPNRAEVRKVVYGVDTNRDGLDDVLHVRIRPSDFKVVITEQISRGDGTFKTGRVTESPFAIDQLIAYEKSPLFRIGDFEGDGVPDLYFFELLPNETEPVDKISKMAVVARFRATGADVFNWKTADVNGDGRADQLYVQRDGDSFQVYSARRTATGWLPVVQAASAMTAAPGAPADATTRIRDLIAVDPASWHVMDVNADGRSDLVYLEYRFLTNVYTLFSRGDGTWEVTYQDDRAYLWPDTRNWMAGDFDGDGRQDLAHLDHKGDLFVRFLRSLGNGTWADNTIWNLGPGWPSDIHHWKLGDVNRDGRSDLIYVRRQDAGVDVTAVLGGTLAPGIAPKVHSKAGLYASETFPDAFRFEPADVNGDGATDLVYVDVTVAQPRLHVRALVSSGGGDAWQPRSQDLSFTPPAGVGALVDTPGWRSIDANGDGRSDLVYVDAEHVYTLLSREDLAAPFAPAIADPHPALGSAPARRAWRAADVSGSGRGGFLYTGLDGGKLFVRWFQPRINGDEVTRLTNESGGTTAVTYATSAAWTNTYLPAGAVLRAVRTLTTSDGRNSAADQTTTYDYAGGKWSDRERYFLGYARMTASTPASSSQEALSSTVEYRQTDNCLAQPTHTWTRDGAGKVLSLTEIDYTPPLPPRFSGPPYTCLPTQEVRYECERICSDDSCPAVCREIRTAREYDTLGNVHRFYEYGDYDAHGDERTTVTGYLPNSTAFIMGLASWRNVYSGYGTLGRLVHRQRFVYDDARNGEGAPDYTQPPRRGDLTATETWNDQTGTYVIERNERDLYGNVVRTIDANSNWTWIEYDPTYYAHETLRCQCLMPGCVPNAEGRLYGLCTATAWDYVRRVPITVTEYQDGYSRKITTTYTHDALARPVLAEQARDAHGNRRYTETRYLDVGVPAMQRVRTMVADGTADGLWSESYFDGLNRTYRTVKKGGTSREVVFADASTRPWKESAWTGSAAHVFTQNRYDAMGRTVEVTYPDGSRRTSVFDVGRATTTDETGNRRVSFLDAYGRIERVQEQVRVIPDFACAHRVEIEGAALRSSCSPCAALVCAQMPKCCASAWDADCVAKAADACAPPAQKLARLTSDTEYGYNTLDQLVQITDPDGNVVRNDWNSLGHRLKSCDPDLGCRTYEYDPAGNLIKETDAKGQVIAYLHDAFGRVIRQSYLDKSGNEYKFVVFAFDLTPLLPDTPPPPGKNYQESYSFGKLTKMWDGTGTESRWYDELGRLERIEKCITNGTPRCHWFATSYDLAGRVATLTYPDPATGWATPYYGEVVTHTYDAEGRLETVKGRDVYVSKITYADDGQHIDTVTHGNGAVDAFTYDPQRWWTATNRVTDSSGTALYDATYGRDQAGRILTITSKTHESWSYRYDDLGRLTRAQAGSSPAEHFAYDRLGNMVYNSSVGTYQYPPAGAPRPHGVVATLRGTGTPVASYTYDANGNLVTGPDRRITWDENNRPVDVEGHHYEYDGNGARVAKHALVGGLTLTSYYVNPHIERDPGGELVSYYYAGPVLVARRDAAGILHYHVDAQGSVRVLTDHRGLEVGKYRYTGFGVPSFTGSTLLRNERKFTSQVHDEETGLMHLGARSYDPALGRFLSADPVIPDPYVPQSLNHYTYALNDPVNLSDQTGFAPKPAEFSPPTQWGDNYVVAENELVYGPGFTRDEFGRMTYSGPLDDNGMPPAPITLAEFVRLRTPDVFRSIGDERVRYSGKDFFENNWPNTTIDEANAAAYRAYDYTRCSFESEWPTIILQAQAMRSAAKAMIPRARPGASGAIIAEVVQETEKRVTVTSWAAKGITPDLSPGRWVQLGEATKWNFFKTGLLGPKAYTKEAFPFIRFEWSKVPLSNSITGEVPVFKVQWPPGWEAWKGILGQRVLAP